MEEAPWQSALGPFSKGQGVLKGNPQVPLGNCPTCSSEMVESTLSDPVPTSSPSNGVCGPRTSSLLP